MRPSVISHRAMALALSWRRKQRARVAGAAEHTSRPSRLVVPTREAHPARTVGLKARKPERVRCSLLVDWPVYPRFEEHYAEVTVCAQFARVAAWLVSFG
jgi:hypothetical protein